MADALPYPESDREARAALARLTLAERASLHWRDLRLAARSYRRPARDLQAVRGTVAPLAADAILLLTVVRNGRDLLPSFLDHYRRLGVRRFAMVDDRSEDGTTAFLDEQADVDRFASAETFREAGGSMRWRDAMLGFYGRNRWIVSVDADEFLLYPDYEHRPLFDFAADLQRAGLKRSLAPMLDLYPAGPLAEARLDPARHGLPTQVSPLIDGTGYTLSREKIGTAIRGGPRTRLFGGENRLSKFPVLFADRATRFAGASHHAPLPLRRNFAPAVTSVLLHFKFSAASVEEFRRFAREGAHFDGSRFYRGIVEDRRFGEGLVLSDEWSLRVGNSVDLVRRGFMSDLRTTPI